MDNKNIAAIVAALAGIFAATPLALADDFLTLALKVTATGTFADTKTVGEAFDAMYANGDITDAEIARVEEITTAIWESEQATRKAARAYAYKYESTSYEAMAIGRNGN